jgi:hypothetical protein
LQVNDTPPEPVEEPELPPDETAPVPPDGAAPEPLELS